MNQIFETVCEDLNNNEVSFVKRNPNIYEIHVVAMSDKFKTWKHLEKLNELLLSNNMPGR